MTKKKKNDRTLSWKKS